MPIIFDPLAYLIDQVPQDLYETIVTLIFTSNSWPVSKCSLMLSCLLRYTSSERVSLEPGKYYAKITIQNLLKTYRSDQQWKSTCSYQTLHTFVRLLCALGLLIKQKEPGHQTCYLMPLDSDYRFRITPTILAAMDRLSDRKHTKNKKVRQKALEVKLRLLLKMEIGGDENYRGSYSFPLQPQLLHERLHCLVDSLGLSLTAADLLFQGMVGICTEILQECLKGSSHDDEPFKQSQRISCLDDSPNGSVSSTSKNLLDPEKESPNPGTESLKVRTENGLNLPLRDFLLQDDMKKSADLVDLGSDPCASLPAPLEHEDLEESSIQLQNLPDEQDQDASLTLRLSLTKGISLGNVNVEATELAEVFKDEGSTKFYASVLREVASGHLDSRIVLAVFLHTLREEQRGHIRKTAGAVFVSMYQRWKKFRTYEAACSAWKKWDHAAPQGIAPDLQQLVAEYERTPYREIAYSMRNPVASPEEDWWSLPAPDVRKPSREMDLAQAHNLVDEIQSLSSFWLEGTHLCQVPSLGEGSYCVEAMIVGTTFPVIYAERDAWWNDHQKQVDLRVWEQKEVMYGA